MLVLRAWGPIRKHDDLCAVLDRPHSGGGESIERGLKAVREEDWESLRGKVWYFLDATQVIVRKHWTTELDEVRVLGRLG